MKLSLLASVLPIALVSAHLLARPSEAPQCPAPEDLHLRVDRKITRKQKAFTEGLVFDGGRLYESTGLYGSSALQMTDPISGETTILARLDPSLFGEGLARIGDQWLELTWKEGRALSWNISGDGGAQPGSNRSYSRVGWGLTSDGTQWIASDGSDHLYFLNRSDLATTRTLDVRQAGGESVGQLNELEWIDGSIWANVYPTNRVVRVDPSSGCVTGRADMGFLTDAIVPAPEGESVMNGIAYDPDSGLIYLTGKNWPLIFVMRRQG